MNDLLRKHLERLAFAARRLARDDIIMRNELGQTKCARSDCQNKKLTHRHCETNGRYYCAVCADRINAVNSLTLCLPVAATEAERLRAKHKAFGGGGV